MMRPSTRPAFWLSAVLFVMLLPLARARSADVPEQVKKIVGDWQVRQERTRNVRYLLQGEAVIPKGKIQGPLLTDKRGLPERDVVCPKGRTVILDLENNRISKDMNNWLFDVRRGEIFPVHRIEKFDGNQTKVFMPADSNGDHINRGEWKPEAWLGTKEKGGEKGGAAVHFEPDDLPMFLAHGLVRTGPDRLVGAMSTPSSLRRPIDGTPLSIRGQGVVKGRTCTILRTATGTFEEEYWVYPDWDSAVLCYMIYAKGKIYETTTIDYRQTDHGWLPERWMLTHSNERIPGAPAWLEQSVNWQVKECVVNADLEPQDFDIATKPGMIVMSPDEVPLRVAKDGHTLIPISEERSLHWFWSTLSWSTLFAVFAGLLVLLLRVRWFRRFRKRAGNLP
jgi:hypothetical protein